MRYRFFLILSALCLPCGVLSVLSKTIQPGKEECIIISIPDEGAHLSGSYDMLDDHLTAAPLAVTLFDDHHEVVYAGRAGVPEGHFSIMDAHGRYSLCIGNGFTLYHFDDADMKRTDHENHRYQLYRDHHKDDDEYDYTNRDKKPRTVGFSIHVEQNTEALMKHMVKTEDVKNPLYQDLRDVTDLSLELETSLTTLLDHQEYMKDRDDIHDEYLDTTLGMLTTWAMIEATILIAVSVGQIMYFRRVFETRRYM